MRCKEVECDSSINKREHCKPRKTINKISVIIAWKFIQRKTKGVRVLKTRTTKLEAQMTIQGTIGYDSKKTSEKPRRKNLKEQRKVNIRPDNLSKFKLL